MRASGGVAYAVYWPTAAMRPVCTNTISGIRNIVRRRLPVERRRGTPAAHIFLGKRFPQTPCRSARHSNVDWPEIETAGRMASLSAHPVIILRIARFVRKKARRRAGKKTARPHAVSLQ